MEDWDLLTEGDPAETVVRTPTPAPMGPPAAEGGWRVVKTYVARAPKVTVLRQRSTRERWECTPLLKIVLSQDKPP